MSEKRKKHRRQWKARPIIWAGVLLFVVTVMSFGSAEKRVTAALADNTLDTLRQQCLSLHKLETSDSAKSLFRLTDTIQELGRHLQENPSLANDAYLEEFADNMRLSGVALLDGELHLAASAYTQRYQGQDWSSAIGGKRLDDLMGTVKVYAQRVETNGQCYDVCAAPRQDTPGVIIGFYQQPSGLPADTESDMVNLLAGLHLERRGEYFITRDGTLLAASSTASPDSAAVLAALTQLDSGETLQFFRVGGESYFGARSACVGYRLYVCFPVSAVFAGTLTAAAVFTTLYTAFWLVLFSLRARALAAGQQELRESNRQLQETVNMLHSLENIYFTGFYVDLVQDRYETIFLAPWLKDLPPEDGTYTSLKDKFVQELVLEQHRAALDGPMSRQSIRDTLSLDKLSDVRHSFYIDYESIRFGKSNWCRVTVTAVDFDDGGAPVHVLIVLQDVNQEKAREARYQARILAEAQEARMANMAKTEFLRRISHDIRTPINGVQGYLNMAARCPDDAAMQAKCREKANVALNALLDLVNNILDMTRLESGQVQMEQKPFDLTQVLDEVRVTNEPQAAERGITYTVERHWDSAAMTHLVGSPAHLRQILMNLVSNAVKYGRPNGRIRAVSQVVPLDAGRVRYTFTCEDNGVGMSEEFQKHLFEPFMQEKEDARTRYQGTGLGLSIVKRLVEAMGGAITFTSRKDVGTTFRVSLPFALDRQYLPERTALPPHSALENVHVLLVEDNELNMEIAEFLLQGQGASVTRAWNGRQALDAFAASAPGTYDIILMDIMMPVMNGMEAARAIRALERPDAASIPIVAMSANAFSDDVQQSLDAGMNAHIAKPVEEQTLLRVMETYLPKK